MVDNIISFFMIELKEHQFNPIYRTMKQIYNEDFVRLCSQESISKVDLEHINLIQERIKEFNEVDK